MRFVLGLLAAVILFGCAKPVPTDAEAPAMTPEQYQAWKAEGGPGAQAWRDHQALAICQDQIPPVIIAPAIVALAAMIGTAAKRDECMAQYRATGILPVPEEPVFPDPPD